MKKRYIFAAVLMTAILIVGSSNINAKTKKASPYEVHKVYVENFTDGVEENYVEVQGYYTDEEIAEAVSWFLTEDNILRKIEGSSPDRLSRHLSDSSLQYVGLYIDEDNQEVVVQYKIDDNTNLAKKVSDSITDLKLSTNNQIELYPDKFYNVRYETVKFNSEDLLEIRVFIRENIDWGTFGLVSIGSSSQFNAVEVTILEEQYSDDSKDEIIDFLLNEHQKYDREYYSDIIVTDFGEAFTTGETMTDIVIAGLPRNPLKECCHCGLDPQSP